MREVILYIALVMIFYDLSLHFLELILGIDKVRKLKPYWPGWIFTKNKEFDRRLYTTFWTIYWLIVFVLILAYLVF